VRLVLQRVLSAVVRVRGQSVAEIGRGFLVLVGVGRGERQADVEWLARKVYHLRVFEDAEGRMELALSDVGGDVLLVPQFTLYGDARKARRPSWAQAAPPDRAEGWVVALADALEELGATVHRGRFREHMEVELVNDGPVTILLESPGAGSPS
jgi:D-aminoacyl-tRNA deacylase